MMRSRAFRPTNEKIVRLELHPTHPWLATADASDNVVVWNWEHRQVVYELNAGGVDTRRLVGAKLQKLAEGEPEPKAKITEAIRGGSVKQIKFYDEDVHFWRSWLNRSAAAEAPVAVNQQFSSAGGGLQAVRGRHFLIICCENKVIFLDMVTMRSRDLPKQFFENRSPLCLEFLSRSKFGDDPLVAFGGSDGVIRVLSMALWQVVRKYVGGHKGSVSCLMTFLSSSGETFLVSGGSDGVMAIWTAENLHDAREISPKQTIKAHDGGVYAIELARVVGGAQQLISIGADKTLAVWDTVSFKDLRRIKPVAKVACCSVASWCHPRAPALDILTCVKDSHIWAVQHSVYSAVTRALCDLSAHVPPSLLAANRKLKCYCLQVHPLQPHLVATGTNVGVILSEFDPKALPAAIALPTPQGSREHSAAFILEKEIRLLTFQLSTPVMGSSSAVADTIRPRQEASEAAFQLKQTKKHVGNVPHDVYSCLSISKSGKYVAVVCPEVPHFTVYRVSDWSVIDSGSAAHFAWDTCKERYALLETFVVPRMQQLSKGRKAKEAAAQAAAAAAAAATAAASATVQVRIILDDGSANQLTRAIEGRTEPVIGLQGGALLGVAYKFPRRISFSNAAAASAAQAAPFSGVAPAFSSTDDGDKGETPSNFQLYSWETFKPVGGLLPQPEWSAWDQTVEYCAFGYTNYVVLSSLRPQYRYLGNVAIAGSTGGVWHRRQLFLATATTIECVFVDAGISAIDLERKRRKEEMKANESQAQAFADHGELALITVETAKTVVQERVPLRPPMLQVVRLASFQHAPTIPPIMALPKQPKVVLEDSGIVKEVEEKRSTAEVAVAGGGVSVALSRLPLEQKRPVGPLVVVGVRDGVLWLIDRYMTAHAIGLGHPGIRCRCLAAHGDPISAVKWAARLGREHHDDLAQFMLGMGYATEALHLPGISKRLEFELALQSNDLKRAFQCLLTLSNSRTVGQDSEALNDTAGLLSLRSVIIDTTTPAESVQGITKYVKEFLQLIDAADATAQTQIASNALRRLAAAGAVKGALTSSELRGLELRLASHGELTRLGVLVNTMMATGQGREAALGAALLGDSALLEKCWEETGMYAEAALHAQAHGRPTLKKLLQEWNQTLEKDHRMSSKKSSSGFSKVAELTDDIVLKELTETTRKPLVEIVPPGNIILGNAMVAPTKATTITLKQAQPQAGQPLMLEGPPAQELSAQVPPAAQGPPQLQGSLSQPAPVEASVATMPSSLEQDPVLAALSQPTTSTNIIQPLASSVLPAPLLSGSAPEPSSNLLQVSPTAAPPVNENSVSLSQPSMSDLPQASSTLLPAVDVASLVTTTPPQVPSELQQLSSQPAAFSSQPLSSLQPLPMDLFSMVAPSTVTPSGLERSMATTVPIPENKAPEAAVSAPAKPAGPSVAALVDFFS